MTKDLSKFSGFIYGTISSASFGLIPLFAIPILNAGMGFISTLLYRFIIATFFLAFILLLKKESFKISRTDVIPLIILSLLYLASSTFLLWGYLYMPGGIATTIHFMYPVITTLIMMLFFRERKSLARIFAIAMAVMGVFFLSKTDTDSSISIIGIAIVLLSAVAYASYLVAVGQLRTNKIKGLKLTFYVFFLGSIFLLAGMLTTGSIETTTDTSIFANLILLALIPTIVSNLTLIEAIKRIGSTQTSVLGAMEPVTAVAVGIIAFGDTITVPICIGIILIISAVTIIILKR